MHYNRSFVAAFWLESQFYIPFHPRSTFYSVPARDPETWLKSTFYLLLLIQEREVTVSQVLDEVGIPLNHELSSHRPVLICFACVCLLHSQVIRHYIGQLYKPLVSLLKPKWLTVLHTHTHTHICTHVPPPPPPHSGIYQEIKRVEPGQIYLAHDVGVEV